jgi:hypothetical protein
MKFSWKGKLLLIAVTAGLATWSGYRAERRTVDAGARKSTVRTMVKRLSTPADQRAGLDRLEALRLAIGPGYPSRREVAEMWAIIRAFSADEVHAALEAFPEAGGSHGSQTLLNMLHYRWAQLEPEAAAQAALQAGDKVDYSRFMAILGVWAQRDPDAAVAWARQSGSTYAEYHFATAFQAKRWVAENPDTALVRARAEFPMAVPNVCSELVAKLSGSPESRKQLYALLADGTSGGPEHQAMQQLARRFGWPGAPTQEVILAEMAEAAFPAMLVDAYRHSSMPVAFREPKEQLEDPAVTGQGRHHVYGRWAQNEPDKALAWAEARGDAGLLAAAVAQQADQLLETAWSPGREGQSPWGASLQKQFTVWQRMDPQAADTWLAAMPGDLKKLVAQPLTPANDAAR